MDKLSIHNNLLEYEYENLLYHKFVIIAIDKCLHKEKTHFRTEKYDTEYASGELIDFRNKKIEACMDKVFEYFRVFNSELTKNGF